MDEKVNTKLSEVIGFQAYAARVGARYLISMRPHPSSQKLRTGCVQVAAKTVKQFLTQQTSCAKN